MRTTQKDLLLLVESAFKKVHEDYLEISSDAKKTHRNLMVQEIEIIAVKRGMMIALQAVADAMRISPEELRALQ